MPSHRLAFIALGVACVVAAAFGGYVANRHETAIVAQPQAAEAAAQPVEATEVVITDPTPVLAPEPEDRAPAVAARPRPAASRPAPSTERVAASPPVPPVPVQSRTPPAEPPLKTAIAEPKTEAQGPVPGEPLLLPSLQAPLPQPVEVPDIFVDELVVPADSVIGLQIESTVTSSRARPEDRVDGRVVRDVRVDGDVAIPAGSRAVGLVTVVEPGGKFRDRARLGIRFHTLVLADGATLPITTETIYRYGNPPGNGSAAKVGGGAVAGAILGAILGGAKGAAIGAAAGAGGGTAAVMAGDPSEATVPAGTEVTARILSPVTVTRER